MIVHYSLEINIKKVTIASKTGPKPVMLGGGYTVANERLIEDVTHVVQKATSLVSAIETAKAILEIAADQEASNDDE